MEKRFFLALLLSFVVLMAYSSLSPKPKHIENKEVVANSVETVQKPPVESQPQDIKATEGQNFYYALENKELGYVYENTKLRLTFSKKGAYIAEVFDKVAQCEINFGAIGLDPSFASYLFDVKEVNNSLVFVYKGNGGFEVKKTYDMQGDYSFRLSVDVINSELKSYEIFNACMTPLTKPDPVGDRYNEVSVFCNNLLQRKAAHSIKNGFDYNGRILWSGLRDKYFCSINFPQIPVNNVVIDKLSPSLAGQKLECSLVAGSTQNFVFDYYVGPQNEKLLEKFKPGTELIVNYGAIDLVAKALLFLVNVAHSITHNWGWAIILMTVFVFSALSPLSIKSFVSMKRIQLLQPKMEELKAKFKDNPQKLHAETMELYKREKINPLGGCLPMILQVPVFIALYQLLMRLRELKGASFLWIKDLSQPDRLIVLNQPLPFIGNEINLLPILMAGTMFAQQKLTSGSTAVSKEAADQQKIMGIMMPIVFGVMFYKISSGLVLYWFVNSLLTLGFQWKISKTKIT